MSARANLEYGALGSLAGLMAILSLWDPQGVDILAVAYFGFAALLIDRQDVTDARWTRQRPFVFLCAALFIVVPLIGGACSASGFAANVGGNVYLVAMGPALYLVSANARFQQVSQRQMAVVLVAGVFAGLVPGILGGLLTTGSFARSFHLYGQPALNITAIYLGAVIAMVLALGSRSGTRVRLLSYAIALVLAVFGLGTGSRTFLVVGAVVGGIHLVATWSKPAIRREIFVIAALGLVAVAGSYFAFGGSLDRMMTGTPFGFFDGRLESWDIALRLFDMHPICGIGPGAFHDAVLNPIYAEWEQQGIDYLNLYHAHNILLNTMAEGGLILSAVLILLTLATAYACFRRLHATPDNAYGWVALTTFALLMVIGTFENTIVRPVIVPLAVFLGLAMNDRWGPRQSSDARLQPEPQREA